MNQQKWEALMEQYNCLAGRAHTEKLSVKFARDCRGVALALTQPETRDLEMAFAICGLLKRAVLKVVASDEDFGAFPTGTISECARIALELEEM